MIGSAVDVAARFATALGQAEAQAEAQTGAEADVVGEDVAGTPGVVVPASRWHDALAFARDELGLDFFDWLSAVDQTDAEPAGFDVVAHLVRAPDETSTGLDRMLLRTRVADGAALASATDLWPGAAWHERETFEMFGVGFEGFEDGTGLGLRPLLLPEGFEGTPLRKSFVLAARASKPWPGAKEPGESEAHGTGSPSRRKLLPPGVPDATWGPRPPGPPVVSAPDKSRDLPGADPSPEPADE
jgi:NADH-quinone oxidoreductase subunit C